MVVNIPFSVVSLEQAMRSAVYLRPTTEPIVLVEFNAAKQPIESLDQPFHAGLFNIFAMRTRNAEGIFGRFELTIVAVCSFQ